MSETAGINITMTPWQAECVIEWLFESRQRCHDMLAHMLDHFEPQRFMDGEPLGPDGHAYDDCVRFMKEEFGEEEQ